MFSMSLHEVLIPLTKIMSVIMRNWAVLLLLTTIMNLLNSGTVLAQDLIVGTWTGTLSVPGFPREFVTYDVFKSEGDSRNITMYHKERSYRFHDIKVTPFNGTTEQLIFKWTPGDDPVECTLERSDRDGAFEGQCAHPKEGRGLELTMIPPRANQ